MAGRCGARAGARARPRSRPSAGPVADRTGGAGRRRSRSGCAARPGWTSWPTGRWRSSVPAPPRAYGEHVAAELGHELAERGWTVVSGGAFGIDAAAHRGALAADGATVAVLACGVDRPYPARNAALFHRIAETGLLVSERPPGARRSGTASLSATG